MSEPIRVVRKMTPKEASALIGTDAPALVPNVPPAGRDPQMILDADGDEPIVVVTRLTRDQLSRLRRAVTGLEMDSVARMSSEMKGGGRTFGWSPRRIMNGRESCRPTSAARDFPTQHEVLVELAGELSAMWAEVLPEQAERDLVGIAPVSEPWRLAETSTWTSGVVNKSSRLPYHRDAMNFPVWSAMPTLRSQMYGGHLHLPEYGLVLGCRDGEVVWFMGRQHVHGVTEMRAAKPGGYRYSVVYYALQGMKDCRTHAEEVARGPQARTERERKLAAEILAGATGVPERLRKK